MITLSKSIRKSYVLTMTVIFDYAQQWRGVLSLPIIKFDIRKQK
jgi:hypothetical protein